MDSSSGFSHQQWKMKARDHHLMVEKLRTAIYRAFFEDLDRIAFGPARDTETAGDLPAGEMLDIDPADEIFPRPLRHPDKEEHAGSSAKAV